MERRSLEGRGRRSSASGEDGARGSKHASPFARSRLVANRTMAVGNRDTPVTGWLGDRVCTPGIRATLEVMRPYSRPIPAPGAME